MRRKDPRRAPRRFSIAMRSMEIPDLPVDPRPSTPGSGIGSAGANRDEHRYGAGRRLFSVSR